MEKSGKKVIQMALIINESYHYKMENLEYLMECSNDIFAVKIFMMMTVLQK